MINKHSYNIFVISSLILLSCVILDPEAQDLLERRQLQEEINFLTAPSPTPHSRSTLRVRKCGGGAGGGGAGGGQGRVRGEKIKFKLFITDFGIYCYFIS